MFHTLFLKRADREISTVKEIKTDLMRSHTAKYVAAVVNTDGTRMLGRVVGGNK